MNIHDFCNHVTAASFGSRIYLQGEHISNLEIHSYSQSYFEQIIRKLEKIIRTLFFHIATQSIDFDILKKRTIQHQKSFSIYTYLSSVFGENRIQRIAQEIGLPLEKIKKNHFIFSKEDLQHLFTRLLILTVADYSDLLSEIIQKEEKISTSQIKRAAVQEQLSFLQDQFEGVSKIEECSEEQLRQIRNLLLPFNSEEEPFLGYDPTIKKPVSFFFSYESYLRHIIHALHHIRIVSSEKDQWELYVGKKISQAIMNPGLVLEHPEGTLVLTENIKKGSSLKKIFTPLGKNETVHAHVFYQGTRGLLARDQFSDFYHTVQDDLQEEIGAIGSCETYQETKNSFININSKGRKITLIGFSLGGAHAQRDAVLFQQYCNRIVTICSPGIDKETAYLFQDKDQSKEISHTFIEGDIVHFSGDVHLGAMKSEQENNQEKSEFTSNITIRYISLSEKQPNGPISRKKMTKKEFFLAVKKSGKSHLWVPGKVNQKIKRISESSSRNDNDTRVVRTFIYHMFSIRDKSINQQRPFRKKGSFAQFILDNQNVALIESPR